MAEISHILLQLMFLKSVYSEKKKKIYYIFSVAARETGTVNLKYTLQYMHVNVKNS